MKKIDTITTEAWLKALVEAERKKPNDPGHTADELRDVLGAKRSKVRDILHDLHKAGKLVVGQKAGTRIDGRPCMLPCYRLKK
jgi:hypothetical protein